MISKIAENIWVADGDKVSFYGMPYPTRMVIVRLDGERLWVYSPVNLTPALQARIESLGKPCWLISPNALHHLFLPEWQQAFPQATTFGTHQVVRKRQDIEFTGSLDTLTAPPWHHDISQCMFTGSRVMEECVFFHHPSRTLIVADLVENFSPEHFKPWQRAIARIGGILAPDGKMPLDWRLSFIGRKAQARVALATMLNWKPDVLVMAHGEIIKQDAEHFLARSFRWLH